MHHLKRAYNSIYSQTTTTTVAGGGSGELQRACPQGQVRSAMPEFDGVGAVVEPDESRRGGEPPAWAWRSVGDGGVQFGLGWLRRWTKEEEKHEEEEEGPSMRIQ